MFDDSYTVGAWIAIDQATAGASICGVTKGLGAGYFNSWAACFTSSLDPFFYSANDASDDLLTATQAVSIGAWHYIAMVWDGATKTLWVDGAAVATDISPGVDFDDDPVYIGGDVDDSAPAVLLTGRVDEVRVYNRALTPSEIVMLGGQ